MHTAKLILLLLAGLAVVAGAAYAVNAMWGPGAVAISTATTPAMTPAATTTPSGAPDIAPAPGEVPSITSASDNSTLYLKKGQAFKVALGSSLRWNLSFDPASSVILIQPADSAGGSQGTYEAVALGTTTLRATGAPICAPQAPCPQFLVAFTATIVVGN